MRSAVLNKALRPLISALFTLLIFGARATRRTWCETNMPLRNGLEHHYRGPNLSCFQGFGTTDAYGNKITSGLDPTKPALLELKKISSFCTCRY